MLDSSHKLNLLHHLWWATDRMASPDAATELQHWHRRHAVNKPWAAVTTLAGVVAAWRRGEERDTVTITDLARWFDAWPFEHGDLFAWAYIGGGPLGRLMMGGVWTSVGWCERLVLAYLLGLDVSHDVHAVCLRAGLASSRSAGSTSRIGPAAPGLDDVAIDALLRQFNW